MDKHGRAWWHKDRCDAVLGATFPTRRWAAWQLHRPCVHLTARPSQRLTSRPPMRTDRCDAVLGPGPPAAPGIAARGGGAHGATTRLRARARTALSGGPQHVSVRPRARARARGPASTA